MQEKFPYDAEHSLYWRANIASPKEKEDPEQWSENDRRLLEGWKDGGWLHKKWAKEVCHVLEVYQVCHVLEVML